MYDLFPGAMTMGLGMVMALACAAVMLTLAVGTFSRRDFSLGAM